MIRLRTSAKVNQETLAPEVRGLLNRLKRGAAITRDVGGCFYLTTGSARRTVLSAKLLESCLGHDWLEWAGAHLVLS
jgi:hypothetical protein